MENGTIRWLRGLSEPKLPYDFGCFATGPNTSCGIIRATANGDTATIAPITCQPLVADGITYTDTILGGTLEVNAQLSTTLRGASSGLCTGPMSGILVRGE